MKLIDKELKKYWKEELPSPPSFPFETEGSDLPQNSEHAIFGRLSWVQNCAGIAFILGLLAVLGSVWGDSRFSVAHGLFDIAGLQDAIPGIHDFLLQII